MFETSATSKWRIAGFIDEAIDLLVDVLRCKAPDVTEAGESLTREVGVRQIVEATPNSRCRGRRKQQSRAGFLDKAATRSNQIASREYFEAGSGFGNLGGAVTCLRVP